MKNIEPSFELSFYLNPQEREQFIQFVHYQTNLDSLDDLRNLKSTYLVRVIIHTKHLFYFLQLLFLPISLEQSSIAYFAAMGCSLLVRNSRSDITGQGFFQNFFAEEETLTMVNFLLIVFTRWQLKLMMVASISIWTLVNTCEWGCWRLKHYPNTPVISVLKPFFHYVKTERIAFV